MTVTGSAITIPDGETERIITDDQGDRTYLVEVTGENSVRVSHNKRYAADGTTLSAGQTHTVSNLRGEKLFAAAFDGASAIRVREASADVQSQPESDVSVVSNVNADLQSGVPNRPSVNAFQQSISGNTTLNGQVVPDGYEAVILADSDNGDDIIVEGTFPLSPGDALSLSVTDTSNVSVDVASGTQTIHVIAEGS